MEIINTIYKDGAIRINFAEDSSIAIWKVYLDSINNRENIYSKVEDKHEYIINEFAIEDTAIVVDVSTHHNTFFIVSVVTEGGNMLLAIAIDEDTLYREKVALLTSFCNTCLDKHQLEVIMMCNLHSQLLDYAVKNNLFEGALDHFTDLARLLNIPETHECGVIRNGVIAPVREVKCERCCNGCCSL